MTCVGNYEIKSPIYKKINEEKKNICTNGKLDKSLAYYLWMFPIWHDNSLNYEYKKNIMKNNSSLSYIQFSALSHEKVSKYFQIP